MVRARDLRVRARLAVELAAVLALGGRRGREREDCMQMQATTNNIMRMPMTEMSGPSHQWTVRLQQQPATFRR